MTARDLIADAAAKLAKAGIESPRLDARLLLAHAAGFSSNAVPATNLPLDEAVRGRFEALLARRLAHEPIAYIIGSKEFWSLSFDVGPGALIPRPETEILIEEMIREYPDREARLDILDLGTGSGCLLVTALREYPRAKGTGIDRDESALQWARRNVAKHGIEARCRLVAGDWSATELGSYDAILANPPYIRSQDIAALARDVERYEPVGALDGGADGLDAYRRIAGRIGKLLRAPGTVFVEIGEGQGAQVASIFDLAGIEIVRIGPDLAGIPRCVVGRRRNRGS